MDGIVRHWKTLAVVGTEVWVAGTALFLLIGLGGVDFGLDLGGHATLVMVVGLIAVAGAVAGLIGALCDRGRSG